ncbi:MAG: 2OG-Fe(II) oxygenase [Blastomonas sp.]
MFADFRSRRTLARLGRSVAERLDAHNLVQKVDAPANGDQVQLYVYQNFLSPETCRMLIDKIDQGAEPSILYKAENSKDFRTSYSCNLDRWDNEVLAIDERICGLMGLEARTGETLQGQRYAVGQYFKPHHDFFHTDAAYWKQERRYGGQRSWTAMIFLNEPEEGGETEFQHLGFQMLPRTGMLFIWNNMKRDGRPNHATLHSGNPVTKGTKYIVTKWFRQGNWLA